jgi:hypothetical protein
MFIPFCELMSQVSTTAMILDYVLNWLLISVCYLTEIKAA